jgi:hypothetical protein
MTKLERFQQFNPEITKIKIKRNEDYVIGWELLKGDETVGYGFAVKVPDQTLELPETEEFDIYEVTGVLDTEFRIVDLDIVLHEDYKGDLWAEEIVEAAYKDQYKDLALDEVVLTEDGGTIDLISGSTISSNAVTRAVRYKLKTLEEVFR